MGGNAASYFIMGYTPMSVCTSALTSARTINKVSQSNAQPHEGITTNQRLVILSCNGNQSRLTVNEYM